jgi:hypothetical protein
MMVLTQGIVTSSCIYFFLGIDNSAKVNQTPSVKHDEEVRQDAENK